VKTKQMRLLRAMSVFTVGLSLVGVTPLAAKGSNCQPVDDALNKVINTPTHIYGSMSFVPSAGGQPLTGGSIHTETIYVGGSSYTKVGGKWSRGDWTPQQVMKQEQENWQESKYTCRYLRDELVNGEAAVVYNTRSERSGEGSIGKIESEGQIWISKNKGLPLRQEFDIESGSSKQHHSVRYEYTNVQPPQLE